MLKYEYTVAKSKNQRRVRLLLSILFLLGSIYADSRKSVSKFSSLRWFLLFEDLHNREESLQANKMTKKH